MGAALAGAEITITESGTNVSHESVTNGTGNFEIDSLNPWVYLYLPAEVRRSFFFERCALPVKDSNWPP